jgi:hypothetical protein
METLYKSSITLTLLPMESHYGSIVLFGDDAHNIIEKCELMRIMTQIQKHNPVVPENKSHLELKLPCNIKTLLLAMSILDGHNPSIQRKYLKNIIIMLDYIGCDIAITKDLRNMDENTNLIKRSEYVNITDLFLWEISTENKYQNHGCNGEVGSFPSWSEFLSSPYCEYYDINLPVHWKWECNSKIFADDDIPYIGDVLFFDYLGDESVWIKVKKTDEPHVKAWLHRKIV